MLTARQADALKARPAQYEVADGQVQGLALRVLPSGAKRWAFRYRTATGWRRIAIGGYPDLGIADARDVAREHLRAVRRDGRDPAAEKREAREARDETFWGIAARYLDRHALGPNVGPRQRTQKDGGPPVGSPLSPNGTAADIWTWRPTQGTPNKRTWAVDRRLLLTDVPRSWRRRPAREISRRDVRELIAGKADAGAPIQANRLRALLHKVFNFAVDEEAVDFNPVTKTPRPGEETKRQRVLSNAEVRQFWSDTEGMPLAMRNLWRLLLVTGQRRGEAMALRWSDLDLDEKVWTIPGEVAKNGLAHRVPLSPLALDLLSELPRKAVYVFAGARGNRQFYEAAKLVTLPDFRGHDLRRTAASGMASAGVSKDHIAKVLNHAAAGVTEQHYLRHAYDAEKRVALDTWAARLAAILGTAEGGAVLPFRATS